MRYRATVHHNGLRPGDEVDLTDRQVEDYAGEIDREFLVPVEDDDTWDGPLPSGRAMGFEIPVDLGTPDEHAAEGEPDAAAQTPVE